MEASDSIDEFFGDQSSDFDDWDASNNNQDNSLIKPFGAATNHDYRSRESSIKTLSYLDGFDQSKEERLQEGFCDGYKQGFCDGYKIGEQFGSLSAKVAFEESMTLTHQSKATKEKDALMNNLDTVADIIHIFLAESIMIGNVEEEADNYFNALKALSSRLESYCT